MKRIVAAVLLVVASGACAAEGPMVETVELANLADVTASEWQRLAARRVFFGHQSVGRQIMDGVTAAVSELPESGLRVVEIGGGDVGAGPGFYHGFVGRNVYPADKTDAFAKVVSSSFTEPGSVAMLKFCYVDVHGPIDADSIFADYQRKIADLRERAPHVTIVHFTMPLHTSESRFEYWKNVVLRRGGERAANAKRNRYNVLLKAAYAGKEPVFDVAGLESRRSDGSRAFFTNGDDVVYEMADEHTYDGGHLHDKAQRYIADQLLIFLAKLPLSR
jgi:hypothetical protein